MSRASKRKLLNTLHNDQDVRQPNVKNSILYTLKDLKISDWDYSFPTIYSNKIMQLKNNMITDIGKFKTAFNKRYASYLTNINYNNVFIAGGSISSVLLQQTWRGSDVDIFIYGLTHKEANVKIVKLMDQIYQSYREHILEKYYEENPSIELSENKKNEIMDTASARTIRSKNCISIRFNNMEVQIILRLYKNISEILYGFDLGSSAVGYDGKDVYFTELGKFAYELFANIVDPSRRSTTYELRLNKYFNRGFHIILPNMNIKELRTDYFKYGKSEVAELPYFPFSYNDIKGNKIYYVKSLHNKVLRKKCMQNKSDYAVCDGDVDEYKIFYLNLRNLAKNENNFYYYSEKMNPNSIIDAQPYISSSRIIDYYDKLSKKIYDGCNFDVKIFMSYFSHEVLPNITESLFLKKDYTSLDKLITEQKELVLERLEEKSDADYEQLQWMTQNPGTQLLGSFNPLISNPKDWYGKYYIDTPAVRK